MKTYMLFCFLVIGFPAAVLSEEIHYIDPASPGAAKLLVKITNKQDNPLPCCLSLKNASGVGIWGLDALGKSLTYRYEPRIWISGETILDGTADTYQYLVSRPPEYKSVSGTITLVAGKENLLVVKLEKIIDMPAQGWYGGDAHQHIVHGEKEFAVNAAIAARIARSEGADWCSFNSGWSSIPGDQPTATEVRKLLQAASDTRFRAFLGDEYPKDHLGHMACLPGTIDDWIQTLGKNEYAYTPERHEAFTHFEILRALQDASGLAIYTHPLREYGGTPDSPANLGRELPFDLLAAPDLIPTVDWMTDDPHDSDAMKLWSMYLNWDYKIGVCAFSDTCYDRHDAAPLINRTYVYLGKNEPTSAALIKAIREGHTFGTTGPLLLATVDGKPPGSTLQQLNRDTAFHIQAYSPGCDYTNRTYRPLLERVVIIRNGILFREFDLSEKPVTDWEQQLLVHETEKAWYVVKVFASGYRQVAITSPFYYQPENYILPKPIPAVVHGIVADASTGKAIRAEIEAVDYTRQNIHLSGNKSMCDSQGKYEIRCAAVQRLRAQAAGYKTSILSPFLDAPTVYREIILPTRAKDMLESKYYDRIRNVMQNVTLNFRLERQ